MKKPESSALIQGDIAAYYYEGQILYSYSKPIKRTVELIKCNVDLVKSITDGKPVPLLIYLCDSPVPDKATRTYARAKLPEIYTAMAMVSKPGLSQLIMRMLFKFQKPPIPIKSFTDDQKAKEWLGKFTSSSD